MISTLQSEDLTQAIHTVLKCIEENRPDLMSKHKNILKLEHFQRFRVQGDVDLLLGMDRQSMHPRPLIMFNQDIAICYVRQPVQNEEFLILTGSTQDIRNLDGHMESFMDSDTALTIQNSQHITFQDKIIHSSHCNLNQHYPIAIHQDDEEHIMEEVPEQNLGEEHQEHLAEENVSDPMIDPEVQQDILPLIAHLTSSDEVSNQQDIEKATEAVPSDIKAKPVNSIFGTVSEWFNKKRGKSNKQSNRSERMVSQDNDKVVSDEQTVQFFLTVTTPRMGIP